MSMTPSAIGGVSNGLMEGPADASLTDAVVGVHSAALADVHTAVEMPSHSAPSTPSHGATTGLSVDDGDESNGSTGSSNKRKRVVLSIHDKQQVLQRLDAGEQPVVIARHFGISRQQVSDIKKNKERILSFCVDAKHVSSLRRKTLKATSDYHPGVEQELYRWMIRQRRLNRVVTSDSLTTKATDLFMQYSSEDSSVSYKTITNWLRQFKKAHGIKILNEDELAKLPERFVPAMDMSRALASGNSNIHTSSHSLASPTSLSAGVSSGNSGIGMSLAMSVTPSASMQVNVDDYIMSNMLAHSHQYHHPHQQQHEGGNDTLKHPLMGAVTTIHELNTQLSYFEREMAVKLDYLDARVEKLCFTALPPRFT